MTTVLTKTVEYVFSTTCLGELLEKIYLENTVDVL